MAITVGMGEYVYVGKVINTNRSGPVFRCESVAHRVFAASAALPLTATCR